MKIYSKRFGQLLKAGIRSITYQEGKNSPIVEFELGEQISRSGATIQRYKSGHIPPEIEKMEILMEAIINRGRLDRKWAEEMLEVTKFPSPEKLLDKYYPSIQSDTKLKNRQYQNLPAPTYGRFVMRDEAYDDLMSALSERWAVILLHGFKGMGKSSLAREVAYRCIHGNDEEPKYDAAVWIGYSERQGATTLNMVLDEIFHTLDSPAFMSLSLGDKLDKAEQLLRRQKVLLIVDGAETISPDSKLFDWILSLPEPSKCLVTSSDKEKFLAKEMFFYELKGMVEKEAAEFIGLKLKQLQLTNFLGDSSLLEQLLPVTSGNPKAIEIILGYMKFKRQSLSKSLEDLTSGGGGLFENLFDSCWGIIDTYIKKVLLAMQLFPHSASAEALSAVADVKKAEFDRAIGRLTDLSLIDVLQKDLESAPRYKLYSLVSAFVSAKNKEDRNRLESFHARWVQWYSELASEVGFCWNDISKLKNLDPSGERQTLQLVINWTFQNKWYEKTIQISKDVRYYFYVRGFWSINPSINLIRAEAARKQSDLIEEFEALLYHSNIASKQGNINEVEQHLPRLEDIIKATKVPENLLCVHRHVKALYFLAKGFLKDAEKLWKENLKKMKKDPADHDYNANRRWYAVCLYRDGKIKLAREILEDALKDAKESKFVRAEIAANLRLAWIDIKQNNYDSAEHRLKKTLEQAAEDAQDQRAIADLNYCQGVIHLARGKKIEAREMLTAAADFFERLGMGQELIEVREKLNAIAD